MADIVNTSTNSMPDWAQPYAAGFLQRSQQVSDQPYQGYGGQRIAGFSPWQDQAYGAQAQRAVKGSPVMSAANGALTGFFGQQSPGATQNPYGPVTPQANPYAGSNPYLQQNIDSAQGDVVRNWNNVQKPSWETAMQRSGSFGNEGVGMANGMAQEGMARQLGNISSGMRMQDYTQQQQLGENAANRGMQAQQFNSQMGESYAGRNDSMFNQGQGRQLGALGLAPGFAANDYNDISQLASAGQQYQNQNQRGNDVNYQQYLDQRNYPNQQLNQFGANLGQAVGNSGTQTNTSPGPSGASQMVGGALTGSALYNLLFGGG